MNRLFHKITPLHSISTFNVIIINDSYGYVDVIIVNNLLGEALLDLSLSIEVTINMIYKH